MLLTAAPSWRNAFAKLNGEIVQTSHLFFQIAIAITMLYCVDDTVTDLPQKKYDFLNQPPFNQFNIAKTLRLLENNMHIGVKMQWSMIY